MIVGTLIIVCTVASAHDRESGKKKANYIKIK